MKVKIASVQWNLLGTKQSRQKKQGRAPGPNPGIIKCGTRVQEVGTQDVENRKLRKSRTLRKNPNYLHFTVPNLLKFLRLILPIVNVTPATNGERGGTPATAVFLRFIYMYSQDQPRQWLLY